MRKPTAIAGPTQTKKGQKKEREKNFRPAGGEGTKKRKTHPANTILLTKGFRQKKTGKINLGKKKRGAKHKQAKGVKHQRKKGKTAKSEQTTTKGGMKERECWCLRTQCDRDLKRTGGFGVISS